MPKKLLPSLLLATVCGLFAACSQHTGAPVVATATTPEKAVRNFYNWRVRTQLTGLPSDQQLEDLKPYISVELHDLLAATAARAKRQSSRKSTGRSFIDGDVFSSLSEGPTSFVPGDIENRPNGEHLVAVQLMSAQHLPAVHWMDHALVIRENDRYVVADIQYANHWRVGNKQTLVGALKQKI